MADELVIVPSDGDGYVELARTRTGRLFRKHILNKGKLKHPAVGEINIDDNFVKTLKSNFDSRVCDIVQVPLAGPQNEHTEAPDRNIGEVIGLEDKDGKVYAVIDARDENHAAKLGKTLLGASAMLSLNYTNTKTGEKVGPALLHTCVTNRPYVTGLEDYEEIVAATSDTSERAVMLTAADTANDAPTKETDDMPESTKDQTTPAKPSLEELLTALKTDHNIDVAALQTKAADGDQAANLTNALVAALKDSGVVALSATEDNKDTVSGETVVSAVAELATNNVTLTNRVNALEQRDAEHAVNKLIEQGRVLPAQKTAYVELKLTNPAMFDSLVPDQPLIKLNNESGVTPPKDEAHTKNVDEEIARLSSLMAPSNK